MRLTIMLGHKGCFDIYTTVFSMTVERAFFMPHYAINILVY
jgi:hypothetical protein